MALSPIIGFIFFPNMIRPCLYLSTPPTHYADEPPKELAESHNQWQDVDFEGILREEGESKIGNNPQLLELQELISVILQENKKAERGGLNPATFCKVIKNLYLTLNSNNDKDLESLVCLLLQHDFLLF